MPTYTYRCLKCGAEMDVFHSMSATPEVACAACGSARTERLLGTGAGIIFKGSGFYETDYKNNGKKGAESKTEAKSEDSGGEKPEKSEAGSDAKTESKPAESKKSSSKSGDAA